MSEANARESLDRGQDVQVARWWRSVLAAGVVAVALASCGGFTDVSIEEGADGDVVQFNEAANGDDYLWFGASNDDAFVRGLSADEIRDGTGLEFDDAGPMPGAFVGPSVLLGENTSIILDVSALTFADIMAFRGEPETEDVGGFAVLPTGDHVAVIDFPEGPVTITVDDNQPAGAALELARLVAQARADLRTPSGS